MVTPVANMPSAARNSADEKVGGWALRKVVTKERERWRAGAYSGAPVLPAPGAADITSVTKRV
jgi:hypothetical protein